MDGLTDIIVGQLKALRPSFFSKQPHFNFITVHYLWIVFLVIVASVIIYGTGRSDMAYIDALFFASSANTQAGLNTIDVNLLNTCQQIIIYIFPMLSNPITVNSFVVFLRLYWFEKRFQHIVREARLRRGTISKQKSRSRVKDSPDQAERGVNGRNITVMHNGASARITNDGILLDPTAAFGRPNGKRPDPGRDEDSIDPRAQPVEPQESRRPEIKFADTVKRSDGLKDGVTKLPPMRPDEDHIAILERQRKGDDEVLRIPGPRDAEKGMLPKRVEQGDEEEPESLTRGRTDSRLPGGYHDGLTAPLRAVTEGRSQTIRIEEPDRPPRRISPQRIRDDAHAAATTLSVFRLRKPRILSKRDKKLHDEGDELQFTPSRRRHTLENIRTVFSRDKEEAPYLSWEPTLGRNSQFPDLTEEQREELGGIEYRSLKTLAVILVCYFVGFSIFAFVCLVPWILNSAKYGAVVDKAGQSRTWWGFFTANSAFLDVGLTLTPDSMNSFNTAVFPMIIMSFLVVIGNTGFPVMLRFIIWVTSLFVPRGTGIWEELRFLLDHPRRCFTLLFPSGATWWLFGILIAMNGIDLIFFIILDLGSGPVSDLPGGLQFLDGLFQAVSTRTAGFSCVNLMLLHPAVQTSYMIMMYISVFPIAISVRRTNVYEEKSLGIYDSGNALDETQNASGFSYVGAHLRRQLSFDLWYISIGFFILTISEGSLLMSGRMSMFAVMFEVISAYGTVGLSFGYTGINASLSARFTVIGKLVIIAMQIRGRHRGLPYGLDRAIMLPRDSFKSKPEAPDADEQLARRPSQASAATGGAGTSLQRRRSRSIDTGNTNIITQFMHPGPAVPKMTPSLMQPRRSTVGFGLDEVDHHSMSMSPARRAETTSFAKSANGDVL